MDYYEYPDDPYELEDQLERELRWKYRINSGTLALRN